MKNALKIIGVLVMLATLSFVATAYTEPYDLVEVEVEGVRFHQEGEGHAVVSVERGQEIDIDVVLRGIQGNEDVQDVRIEAVLGGYDRKEVRAVTDSFTVEAGVFYPAKRLTLALPDDLDTRDTYTLQIRAYDQHNSISWGDDTDPKHEEGTIELRIVETEHSLKILDVDFDPNLNYVEAGDRLFADVRVENLGYQTEEDVRVVMEIPSLNLFTSSYIDRLDADRECDRDNDFERSRYNEGRCQNSETEPVSLQIPSDAEGTHDVFIRVEYDDGDEVLEEVYTVTLTEVSEPTEPTSDTETEVTVDLREQDVEQGEGVVYRVSITNLGSEAQTYTLNLVGVDSWATYSIDPSTVVVGSEGTEEVFVFVNADEDAREGTRNFVLEVESDLGLEEVTLTAEVEESENEDTWESVKLGLEIGFIVLLVILIILGLVLAFRKRDGNLEDPTVEGEDTYY